MSAHSELFSPLLHWALERDATDIMIIGDNFPVCRFATSKELEPIMISGVVTTDMLREAIGSLITLSDAETAVYRCEYGPFKMVILKASAKLITSFHYETPEIPDTAEEFLPTNPSQSGDTES